MDKLIDFISWVAANIAPLALPSPTKKDIEEFNKQQPEPSHPIAFGVVLLLALLILFASFIFLAFV